ncbi:MAG: hypothetical protein HYU57_05895 [Micavibrio aeruginosavorus]|nr:hypothetical protein [Micavibrio aeruginosavorus]
MRTEPHHPHTPPMPLPVVKSIDAKSYREEMYFPFAEEEKAAKPRVQH